MFSCVLCGQRVGFFSLSDKICTACHRAQMAEAKGKFLRILSFAPLTGFLFLLGFFAHGYSIYLNGRSAPFSAGMMMVSAIALLVVFVLRFYLIRRSFNFFFAALVVFPFVGLLSATSAALSGGGPMALTTLGFVLFPYFVLRTPNAFTPNEKGFSLRRTAKS